MYNDINNLKLVVHAINDCDLQDNMILVGSWCEFFYQDLFDTYTSNMKTRDHDILIKRPVSKGDQFHKTMIEYGFSYFDDDGKSKYMKGDNEVEFLTTLGRNYEHIYKIPNIKLNAECLPYFDIIIQNLQEAELDNMKVLIPSPPAYVLHKLIINPSRKIEKKQKDIDAVSNIIIKMMDEELYGGELKMLYASLPKKQKAIVDSVVDEYNIVPFKQLIDHYSLGQTSAVQLIEESERLISKGAGTDDIKNPKNDKGYEM